MGRPTCGALGSFRGSLRVRRRLELSWKWTCEDAECVRDLWIGQTWWCCKSWGHPGSDDCVRGCANSALWFFLRLPLCSCFSKLCPSALSSFRWPPTDSGTDVLALDVTHAVFSEHGYWCACGRGQYSKFGVAGFRTVVVGIGSTIRVFVLQRSWFGCHVRLCATPLRRGRGART